MRNGLINGVLILGLCLVSLGVTGCGNQKEDIVIETTTREEESTVLETAAEETLSKEDSESDVDVDLTVLSPIMVYSEVYNMMAAPEKYIEKTVRINGPFVGMYYEPTDKNYFYVIIEDATACCTQGMEFVLAGDFIYPDDYPEENEYVTVTGIFETYTEEGDENIYTRLRDAVIEDR